MRELIAYFQDVVRILSRADPEAQVVEAPDIDERDNQLGRLSFSVRYRDGSRLVVRLWADCSGDHVRWPSYSFQYLDSRDRLRFRYDDAPHHPELPNFPHHLHAGSDERNVFPHGPPPLRALVDAIRWHLDHPGGPWEPSPS